MPKAKVMKSASPAPFARAAYHSRARRSGRGLQTARVPGVVVSGGSGVRSSSAGATTFTAWFRRSAFQSHRYSPAM